MKIEFTEIELLKRQINVGDRTILSLSNDRDLCDRAIQALSQEVRALQEREKAVRAQLDLEREMLSKVGEHLGCERDGRESATYFVGIRRVIDSEWAHKSEAE